MCLRRLRKPLVPQLKRQAAASLRKQQLHATRARARASHMAVGARHTPSPTRRHRIPVRIHGRARCGHLPRFVRAQHVQVLRQHNHPRRPSTVRNFKIIAGSIATCVPACPSPPPRFHNKTDGSAEAFPSPAGLRRSGRPSRRPLPAAVTAEVSGPSHSSAASGAADAAAKIVAKESTRAFIGPLCRSAALPLC